MQSKGLREFLKAGGFSRNKAKNGIKDDKYNHSNHIPKKGVNNTGAGALQKILPSNKVYYSAYHTIINNAPGIQKSYSGRNIEDSVII